jgi:DNA modification methylase
MIKEVELEWPNDVNPDFDEPSISILDRRSQRWQARKRYWRSLGLENKQGRESNLIYRPALQTDSPISQKIRSVAPGTSQFDPALAELLIQWFSTEGDDICDPFCGGSVRGIVASRKKRHYFGFDVYEKQIEANKEDLHLANKEFAPVWEVGSSLEKMRFIPDHSFDFVFTCPPYWNLEIYGASDDDISNLSWPDFIAALSEVINLSYRKLDDDRFFCIVVGDVRDKDGFLKPLLSSVVQLAEEANFKLYNHLVTADIIGSGAMIMKQRFSVSRKVVSKHQHCLVFIKGNPKTATRRLEKAKTL